MASVHGRWGGGPGYDCGSFQTTLWLCSDMGAHSSMVGTRECFLLSSADDVSLPVKGDWLDPLPSMARCGHLEACIGVFIAFVVGLPLLFAPKL